MTLETTAPARFCQGGSSLTEHVRKVMKRYVPMVVGSLDGFLAKQTPESFVQVEESVHKLLSRLADQMVGSLVEQLLQDRSRTEWIVEDFRGADPRKLRHRGWRTTTVRFLGGTRFRFKTPYLSTDREGAKGRRRGVGRRGEAGGGVYPVLEHLGIRHQATPALASLVAKQSVRCGSFEEAREALEEQGVHMDAKGVRRLALDFGDDALEQREERRAAAARGESFSDEFVGKRVVISIDGGRLRLREGGRRGRKGKNGHRRYQTPWREPKIFTIYVIDEKGRKIRSIRPILDGTLGDADAAFDLLVTELLLRGGGRCNLIVATGDGAPWIWLRVKKLVHALGLSAEQIVEVADFYTGAHK